MDKSILKIDVSKKKCESDEEDLIKIKLSNGEIIETNFSKLIKQSKYIRDKYKYSEAQHLIQHEMNQIKTDMHINNESIKLFIQLIQEEKVNIPIEHYKDLYALSDYFDIPKFIQELDEINQNEIYKDLNFTIQILEDLLSTENENDNKFQNKIENFLTNRINECIQNRYFGELPISTIYRIIEKSNEEDINQDFLIDFILKSIDTRFILFKFIKLCKLKEETIKEFVKFCHENQYQLKEEYF